MTDQKRDDDAIEDLSETSSAAVAPETQATVKGGELSTLRQPLTATTDSKLNVESLRMDPPPGVGSQSDIG